MEMDEERAASYFKLASETGVISRPVVRPFPTWCCRILGRFHNAIAGECGAGHAAGLFMYGDCLLEATGCAEDGGLAVRCIHAAAEQGHRGARSRLMSLLKMDGQVTEGIFTDSSRQSLIDR